MVSNGNGNSGQNLHHKRKTFLEHYENFCVIGRAAKATGICRTTVYDWIEKSEEFKQAFESAKKGIVEKLETEAIRRAYDGIDKGVWHRGERVGVEKEYSDTLLIFLLKGNDPKKYRERYEITGKDGEPLEVNFHIGKGYDNESKTS